MVCGLAVTMGSLSSSQVHTVQRLAGKVAFHPTVPLYTRHLITQVKPKFSTCSWVPRGSYSKRINSEQLLIKPCLHQAWLMSHQPKSHSQALSQCGRGPRKGKDTGRHGSLGATKAAVCNSHLLVLDTWSGCSEPQFPHPKMMILCTWQRCLEH